MGNLKVNINWIFTNGMLHTETNDPEQIILTTTEREFIRHSKYDMPDNPYRSFGSLHYLNAENRELSTFRCLSLYHEPQVYKGKNKTDSLDISWFLRKTVNLFFLGEYAELKEYQENLKAKSPVSLDAEGKTPPFLNALVHRISFLGMNRKTMDSGAED